MSPALLVPALLLLAYVAWRIARWYAWARICARPSPSGATWIMGHAKAVAHPRHHRTLLRWDAEVPGPLFCFRVLWARVVVVSHPAMVHQLLRGTPGGDKSQITYGVVNPLLSPKGYPSLFSASTHSPYWRLVRKGVAPGFSLTSLRSGFQHIQAVVAEMLAVLQALGDDQAFDLDNLLMRSTMDVIGLVGFGINFHAVKEFRAGPPAGLPPGQPAHPGPEGQDIFTIVQESMEDVHKRWSNPLRRFLWWTPEVRAAMRYWRAFQARMQQLAEDVRARNESAGSEQSIAARLLRLRDPHTGQPLSVDRLVPEIATFFVAGMDTTAHTMAWTLYLVSQHEDVERKLCAELDALGLLATPTCPEPRQVEWEDCGRLPYLTATIKECMRILPVSADSTEVEFSHDIQLGGYTVPAGTSIWAPIFTTHNSPRYWENPESFLPERFLQPGAEYASAGPLGREAAAAAAEAGDGTHAAATPGGAEAVVRRAAGRSNLDGGGSIGSRSGTGCVSLPEHGGGDGGGRTFTTAGAVDRRAAAAEPLRFFPFSQGARDCVGQSLARVNYTATLAALLGRFAFQLAHEAAGPGGVCDVVKLTLQPEHGIPMHAVPRVALPRPDPAAEAGP